MLITISERPLIGRRLYYSRNPANAVSLIEELDGTNRYRGGSWPKIVKFYSDALISRQGGTWATSRLMQLLDRGTRFNSRYGCP